MLIAAIGLLTLAVECGAFPYRPAAAVHIVSEYAALNHSLPSRSRVWRVTGEEAFGGAATLRFFMDGAAPETGAVCEITLPPFESAGEILWESMGKKKTGTGILLATGFPSPCDILPVGHHDSGGVYEERSEAGGSAFSRSYRVSFATISAGEAKTMGWIRENQTGIPKLIMVSVTDDRDRPLVRQLWPVDGSWWLYEETPLRRSWLVY
jgi:hypothetical protein